MKETTSYADRTIRVLSESMISKIAAGEVIERPASVVKELVENSIDAGAGSISVGVVEGGQHAIQVTDDGSGMSAGDVELSVERHATSKILMASDLFDVATLGFRGEALASIAAVSRLTIESRLGAEQAGSRLVVEGGIRRSLESIGRAQGTTVTVRNIFFNTPARRKFLRRVDTEMRHIIQVVSQLGAACPQIGFHLSHAGRNIFDTYTGTLEDRGRALLSVEGEELVEVSFEDNGVSIHGFLVAPEHCRRSKSRQFIVVDGRPVYSRSLIYSIGRAYEGLKSRESHPAFIICLNLQPRTVDVNVHPSKREIRISKEWEIGDQLERAVHNALVATKTSRGPTALTVSLKGRIDEAVPRRFYQADNARSQMRNDDPPLQLGLHTERGQKPSSDPPNAEDEKQFAPEGPIWQIHRKYIMAPVEDGIMVFDQHVAHERIRYEEALDCFNSEAAVSQQLLMPFTVSGDNTEMEAIRESEELLRQLGFGVRDFGPKSVIVDSIPVGLKNWKNGNLFHKIVSEIIEEKQIQDSLKTAVAASYACHTSIKAGEKLSEPEMRTLIKRLLKTRKPNACPHGRPIIVRIPLDELDRHFERS